MTIMLVFGSYGGFYASTRRGMIRICLGWVAVTVVDYDIENAMENMQGELRSLKHNHS